MLKARTFGLSVCPFPFPFSHLMRELIQFGSPGRMHVNLLGMHSMAREFILSEILRAYVFMSWSYRFSQVVNDAFSLRKG